MDSTCTVDEISTMGERGQKMYGQLPRTGSQRRVMPLYRAETALSV
jgi:hypothetical protein